MAFEMRRDCSESFARNLTKSNDLRRIVRDVLGVRTVTKNPLETSVSKGFGFGCAVQVQQSALLRG